MPYWSPEATIDELKDNVQVAERLMDAALRTRDEGYMVSAHRELSNSHSLVTSLMTWKRDIAAGAEAGPFPRRAQTWIGRYTKAWQRHHRLAERIAQGAWY